LHGRENRRGTVKGERADEILNLKQHRKRVGLSGNMVGKGWLAFAEHWSGNSVKCVPREIGETRSNTTRGPNAVRGYIVG